ncbi:MAG: peptidoglycan-binding protein [Kiloniellaceae bacterium]
MRTGLRRATGVLGFTAALLAGFPAAAAADLDVEELAELERLLDELSFDPGTIDGVVDERTRGAIRLYQDFAALPADGVPSKALLAELRQVVQVFLELKAAQQAAVPAAPEPEEAVPDASPAPDRDGSAAAGGAFEAPAPEHAAPGEAAAAEVLQEPEAEDAPADPAEAPAEATETIAALPAPKPAAQGDALAAPKRPASIMPPGKPAAEAEALAAPNETIADRPVPKPAARGEALAAPKQPAEPEKTAVALATPRPAEEPVEPKRPAVSADAQAAAASEAEGPPRPKTERAFDLEGVIARLVKRGGLSAAAEPSNDQNLVLSIQRNLKRIGMDPGPVDGRMGARTVAAIEAYQRQHGLPVDGRATRELLAHLDGAAAGPAPRRDEWVGMPVPPVGRPDGYRDFKRGFAAAERGDLDFAIELYTRAIEAGDLSLEHLADALFNRANAYHVKELYDYAIADYSAAIVNKPDFPEAYHNRGFAFEAKGARARAARDFARAGDLGLQRSGLRTPDIPPPLP